MGRPKSITFLGEPFELSTLERGVWCGDGDITLRVERFLSDSGSDTCDTYASVGVETDIYAARKTPRAAVKAVERELLKLAKQIADGLGYELITKGRGV